MLNNLFTETPDELEHAKTLSKNMKDGTKEQEVEWRKAQLQHIFGELSKIYYDDGMDEYVVIHEKLCLLFENDFIQLYRQGFRITVWSAGSNTEHDKFGTTVRLKVHWGYKK